MCRRIEENLCRSRINIDCFTDGIYRRNSVVGISQRVGNKLRACATISDGLTDRRQSPTEITDGIVPSVFHREFEKNYGLCHYFRRNHRRQLPMKITDGTYTSRSARLSEPLLQTDKNKRRHFRKFWCAFQFISRRNYRRK